MPTFEFTQPPSTELIVHSSLSGLQVVTAIPRSRAYPNGYLTMPLGGQVIAEACAQGLTGGEQWLVRLQYHGGRNTWMVENERYSPLHMYPRDDIWGDLSQMMALFESATGLSLPTLRLVELGIGVTDYTPVGSSASASNPWQLEPGTYSFVRGGARRRIEALRLPGAGPNGADGANGENGPMAVRFVDGDTPSETFMPAMVLDAAGWLTLTREPETVAEAVAEADHVVAAGPAALPRRPRP